MIEAGLGGRLDATNTIPSRVTVLTSIGLDHTEWLGDTEARDRRREAGRAARSVDPGAGQGEPGGGGAGRAGSPPNGGRGFCGRPRTPGRSFASRAPGSFQRRNFALALAAAEAFLGELDSDRVAEVAATLTIPGRLEQIAERPPTLIDAAHNPDGAAALAEALPALAAGRPVIACLAILEDKDAAAMVAGPGPGPSPRGLHRASGGGARRPGPPRSRLSPGG